MPTPMYNNASLHKQEIMRKLGITTEQPQDGATTMSPPQEEYVPGNADEILAGARGTLDKANAFGAENDTESLARLPDALAGLRRAKDSAGPLRRITDPLATMGNAAVDLSLPAALMSPAVGAALGVGGTLASAPDYLRRLISPDADESRPGGLESAGMGLGMIPVMSSLRGLKSAGKVAGAWGAAKEVPYAAEATGAGSWVRGARDGEATGEGLASLRNAVGRATKPEGYADELGRALNAQPTPNAASVFDEMSAAGQFGPEQKAFTARNPRAPVQPAAPQPVPVRGRDLSQLGGPSLKGLREALVNDESLNAALKNFDPEAATFSRALEGAAKPTIGAAAKPTARTPALPESFKSLPSDEEMLASLSKRKPKGKRPSRAR